MVKFLFVSETNAGRPHGENSEMGTGGGKLNWKRRIIICSGSTFVSPYGPWAGTIQVLGFKIQVLGTHFFGLFANILVLSMPFKRTMFLF